jgi:flagellar basal-body rod protein FlgG
MSLTIGTLYGIAYSGLHTRELEMATISHNLANLQTVGYKRVQLVAQDLIASQEEAEAAGERWLPAGTYLAATRRLTQQGAIETTGNPWDLALDGPGYFQVQEPDGTISYTRAGAFHINGDGRLATLDGASVLPPVTLPVGAQDVYVDRRGRILAEVNGQVQVVATLQIARFANPEGLQMIGANRFLATAASGPAQLGQPGTPGYAEIVAQALEKSNVDLSVEAIAMVAAQRAYSLNLRMLQITDRLHTLALELRA